MKKNILLVTVVVNAILGCGSGSSTGTPTPTPTPTNMTGLKYQINKEGVDIVRTNVISSTRLDQSGQKILTIFIDDKKVELFPDSKYVSSDKSWVLRANQFLNGLNSYVSFYQYTNGESSDGSYRFYIGKGVTSIPQSGSATYSGYYTFEPLDTTYLNNKTQHGRLSFKADFNEKKVSGSISELNFSGAMSDVYFSGNINSATFSGIAKINEQAKEKGYKDGTLQGHFFGSEAKGAGGIIVQADSNKKQTWVASFSGEYRNLQK